MRSFIGSFMVSCPAASTANADMGTESRTPYASCICKFDYPDPVCRPATGFEWPFPDEALRPHAEGRTPLKPFLVSGVPSRQRPQHHDPANARDKERGDKLSLGWAM